MEKIHYKSFGFRLHDGTRDDLNIIKKLSGLSYNLLFLDLIKIYKKSDKFKNLNKKLKEIRAEEQID